MMAPTRDLVILIFLGSLGIVLGRVDVGKAFGKARAILQPHQARDFHRRPIKVRVSNPDIDEVPINRYRPNDEFVYEPVNAEPIDNAQTASRLRPAVGATPCHTPEQWEGRASEWDHIQGINNRFNITFDGVNRRKRIMEDKHAQLPGKRIYEYIMLYDEGIQYVINHNYNTCTVEQLGTWRNFTIPSDATLEDYYEIGAPGNGFMVQEWSDRIPGRQKESWIGTFTDNGCWPVTEIFMEKDENKTMIQSVSTRFFDLRENVANMSVFTPPSFCNDTNLTITPKAQNTETRSRPVRPRYGDGIPANPRTRLQSSRRIPSNVPVRRPQAPRSSQNKRERMIDPSRMENERSLLEAILSGDHRRIPEGMGRMTQGILHKAYDAAVRSGRRD
nr:uncharacterized protein LOC129266944 [Lytechinus pictus]